MSESCLPKVQSSLLNAENVESLMKDFLKGFIQQEVKVENSLISKLEESPYESEIIDYEQFRKLQNWLPFGFGGGFKRLYQGSVDGMSPEKFHAKCDHKGAFLTLVKCRFEKASGSSVIGGFVDQGCHSYAHYINSTKAFLFSFKEGKDPIRCSIGHNQWQYAFLGAPLKGPIFGFGKDLEIRDDFKTGSINPKSYSNASALCEGSGTAFSVEEIEVFQVQESKKFF